MDNLEYKGYYGSVEYSKAENCLVGKLLGMTKDSITYEGNTIEELIIDFKAGVDSYLEGCAELGITPRKAFSGSLNVRIPSEIHGRVAMLAESAGVSINAFIKDTLKEKVYAH